MRILLLTTGLKLGGAEQQVAALARQFIAMGHAVAVVSLTPGQGVRLPDAATLLQLQMSKTPMSMAKALWQLRICAKVAAGNHSRPYGPRQPSRPRTCGDRESTTGHMHGT